MDASDLEREVRARLQAFQDFDPRWAEAATVIAVGTLQRGTYPCIFREDGSRDMPMSHVLRVSDVLRRGPLRRETIDLSLPFEPRPEFPERLENARRYLVFLRPSEVSAQILSDPDEPFTVYSQLDGDDLIAVIDLDQTHLEAKSHRRRVATWTRRQAFVLDKETWSTVRAQSPLPAEDLAMVLHAIHQRALAELCTRKDVQARFGPPDEVDSSPGEVGSSSREVDSSPGEVRHTYFVSARDRREPKDGTCVARIGFTYDAEGVILEVEDQLEIFDGGRLRPMTWEELDARELTSMRQDRRRGGRCGVK